MDFGSDARDARDKAGPRGLRLPELLETLRDFVAGAAVRLRRSAGRISVATASFAGATAGRGLQRTPQPSARPHSPLTCRRRPRRSGRDRFGLAQRLRRRARQRHRRQHALRVVLQSLVALLPGACTRPGLCEAADEALERAGLLFRFVLQRQRSLVIGRVDQAHFRSWHTPIHGCGASILPQPMHRHASTTRGAADAISPVAAMMCRIDFLLFPVAVRSRSRAIP